MFKQVTRHASPPDILDPIWWAARDCHGQNGPPTQSWERLGELYYIYYYYIYIYIIISISIIIISSSIIINFIIIIIIIVIIVIIIVLIIVMYIYNIQMIYNDALHT